MCGWSWLKTKHIFTHFCSVFSRTKFCNHYIESLLLMSDRHWVKIKMHMNPFKNIYINKKNEQKMLLYFFVFLPHLVTLVCVKKKKKRRIVMLYYCQIYAYIYIYFSFFHRPHWSEFMYLIFGVQWQNYPQIMHFSLKNWGA